MQKIIVIGSGFAGLSAASFMAKAGWDVTLLEKHLLPGGRAQKFLVHRNPQEYLFGFQDNKLSMKDQVF